MLFHSVEFLLFFPLVCLLYFLLPHRFRNAFLFIANLVFYACADLWALPFLLGTTLVTWICGRLLYAGKRFAFVGLFLTFGLLALFKYGAYVLELFHTDALSGLLLPLGISFYTFQSATYLFDCYRKECKPERNLLRYALFVSFFPTILAGPIERAKHLLPQFERGHSFDTLRAKEGLSSMLFGYFLKMVIVSRLTILTDLVFSDASMEGLPVLLAVFAYSFQIYCDFAGYSLIALGCGKILGFDLIRNFRQPYLAGSIADFWRRWHISLSSWFRDYLYIPLGGNRKGTLRRYLNILIVFALSGVWHGANVTFLLWGLLNGIFQIVAGVLAPLKMGMKTKLQTGRFAAVYRRLKIVGTFLLITLTWVFFRAPSVTEAVSILGRLFRGSYVTALTDGTIFTLGLGVNNLVFVIVALILLFAVDLLCEKKKCEVSDLLRNVKLPIRWAIYYLVIAMILFSCNLSTQEFLYAAF